MYTFYFKQVTDKSNVPRFRCVAYKGREYYPPIWPLLGQTINYKHVAELNQDFQVVFLPKTPQTGWNDADYMHYAKGYRGPAPKVESTITAGIDFRPWSENTRDLCQDESWGARAWDAAHPKPSIGPLPPQAPISTSQKSQDELEPLPGVREGYVAKTQYYLKDPAYSPGDLAKMKRELREQFEQGPKWDKKDLTPFNEYFTLPFSEWTAKYNPLGDPNKLYEAPQGTILDPRDSAKVDKTAFKLRYEIERAAESLDAEKIPENGKPVNWIELAHQLEQHPNWNFRFTPIAPKGYFPEMEDPGKALEYYQCGQPSSLFPLIPKSITIWTKLKDWFWGTNRVGF